MATADSANDLGPWAPLTLAETVKLFAPATFRWWLAGCHALELHLEQQWRDHNDIDVGIVRSDAPQIISLLGGWDIHLAHNGVLSPWDGGPLLGAKAKVGNLWCRPSVEAPWALDILVGDGTKNEWVYRRDPAVRRPWREVVLHTSDRTPHLAPEIQLLFKSKTVRPKDQRDAEVAIPLLALERRTWLANHLPPDHPWQAIIGTP